MTYLRRCLIVRLLSYLLFTVVGFSGGLSLFQEEYLFFLSFLTMFLSGAICLIALDSNEVASNEK